MAKEGSKLHWADWIIIACYFAFSIGIGLFVSILILKKSDVAI